MIVYPGKIPPSKINLGMFHNSGKNYLQTYKMSLRWNMSTSSALPPNYSIRAKGSTSQSSYFEPCVEKACFGCQGGFKIKTFMAFPISAILGFHGGSLASSGTSALQDRATVCRPLEAPMSLLSVTLRTATATGARCTRYCSRNAC